MIDTQLFLRLRKVRCR